MISKCKHNFARLSPMCVCSTGKEDNEHFPPRCPLYSILHQDLFDQPSGLADIYGFNFDDVSPKELCPLLLFGDWNLGSSSSSYWLFRLIQDISLATVFFHSFRS